MCKNLQILDLNFENNIENYLWLYAFSIFFLFYVFIKKKKTVQTIYQKEKKNIKMWPRSYKCILKLEVETAMNNTGPLFN